MRALKAKSVLVWSMYLAAGLGVAWIGRVAFWYPAFPGGSVPAGVAAGGNEETVFCPPPPPGSRVCMELRRPDRFQGLYESDLDETGVTSHYKRLLAAAGFAPDDRPAGGHSGGRWIFRREGWLAELVFLDGGRGGPAAPVREWHLRLLRRPGRP